MFKWNLAINDGNPKTDIVHLNCYLSTDYYWYIWYYNRDHVVADVSVGFSIQTYFRLMCHNNHKLSSSTTKRRVLQLVTAEANESLLVSLCPPRVFPDHRILYIFWKVWQRAPPLIKKDRPTYLSTYPLPIRQGARSTQEMDESESGQMVLEKVKWTYFDAYMYDKQCEIMQKSMKGY